MLRATPDENENKVDRVNSAALQRVGKAMGSAFLGLTLGFSAITTSPTVIPPANADVSILSTTPSITIAAKTKSADDDVIKELENETRKVEKEAKVDERKARVEKSREAFFQYEERMAEQAEARIEAAERKAEVEAEQDKLEAEKDKEQAEELKAAEVKAEREVALAKTKKEKLAKEKEAKVSVLSLCVCDVFPAHGSCIVDDGFIARSDTQNSAWCNILIISHKNANAYRHISLLQALLKKEKEVERKEREAEKKEKKAERAERVFLAEEQQEQKILKQKVAAEQAVSLILLKKQTWILCIAFSPERSLIDTYQEEKKFEAVEKEYEEVAELAKEDEIELG